MDGLTTAELVAQEVVEDFSPAELEYFPVALRHHRSDPDQRPRTESADAELGMGVEIGLALAPIVLWVVHQVLDFSAGLVLESAVSRSRSLRSRIARALRRVPLLRLLVPRAASPDAAAVADLDDRQLELVREVARERARSAGVAGPQAELLADAIVGRLVLAARGT
jgi:hypothetical protein